MNTLVLPSASSPFDDQMLSGRIVYPRPLRARSILLSGPVQTLGALSPASASAILSSVQTTWGSIKGILPRRFKNDGPKGLGPALLAVVNGVKSGQIAASTPIRVLLTLSATGSKMSSGSIRSRLKKEFKQAGADVSKVEGRRVWDITFPASKIINVCQDGTCQRYILRMQMHPDFVTQIERDAQVELPEPLPYEPTKPTDPTEPHVDPIFQPTPTQPQPKAASFGLVGAVVVVGVGAALWKNSRQKKAA